MKEFMFEYGPGNCTKCNKNDSVFVRTFKIRPWGIVVHSQCKNCKHLFASGTTLESLNIDG